MTGLSLSSSTRVERLVHNFLTGGTWHWTDEKYGMDDVKHGLAAISNLESKMDEQNGKRVLAPCDDGEIARRSPTNGVSFSPHSAY